MAQDSYEKYKNPYEEDLEILKDDKLTFNLRNCVLFRSGEKEILLFFINNIPKILKLFDLDFKVNFLSSNIFRARVRRRNR